MHSQREDVDLTPDHIRSLSSADRLAEFFAYLRYPLDDRLEMTPEALQLNATLTNATRQVERQVNVDAGALQIYLFELTSVTVAYTRALARSFRNRAGNFLLVLTDDYQRIDFVLLERALPGLTDDGLSHRSVIVRPRILSVDRRAPGRVDLRVLRRFTFTEFDTDGRPDPYAQFDKLSSAYAVAEWSEPLFNNRALFSDYYLNERLPEDPVWESEGRNRVFREVRGDFAQARRRFAGEDAVTIRQELIRPLLETLDFRVEPGPGGAAEDFYLHTDDSDEVRAFVLAYPWNRYLDGKDASRDDERPEENPGAQVVSLLDAGSANWGIVTNGKLWRLYSARAHSRATNYYEINLEETLASPNPGEAFRYFYLFFRAQAFALQERPVAGEMRQLTFLDWLMEESETYSHDLGERLKDRVFDEIFPHLAEGFIEGMGGPEALLQLPEGERDAQLQLVYEATLTFLYRLLFLLYAESRDLLPVREVRGYYQISLRRLKEEVAQQAGQHQDQVDRQLEREYKGGSHSLDEKAGLYDRLLDLFKVIDHGSAARNVPIYNGGLFMTDPAEDDSSRGAQGARFLEETRHPDRYLALGLDRLARDVDPKHHNLGFIDYKSLGVRQLGSIYEGVLEFKVRVAAEKMAVVEGKRTEEVIPYTEALSEGRKVLTRGRGANASERTYLRGDVYLENDRRERKATGSYYTPDYIVKYIVRQTVGPVLDEKLDALRPRLQETERRFNATIKHKQEVEGVTPNEPAILQELAADVLYDLFDIKILDPAMGSGHFLVEAVDYVTDRLVRFLDGFPFLGIFFDRMRQSIIEEMERQKVTVDPARLTDVTLLKRHVLKRCIYGVDLNPMAVELAKVSLWLDCFTLGAPLSFLDHHLRRGNSLIGTMAREVEDEMGAATPEGQSTFLTGPFVGLLKATSLMQTLAGIADVTLEQVYESRTLFDDFEMKARPYKQLLDVYVAQHFGVERTKEFLNVFGPDVMRADPDGIESPYREIVAQTRTLYEEKRFFHWDLEFPEVFIDLDRATWKENGGFDAVIGNPPYVDSEEMTHSDPELRRYCKDVDRWHSASGNWDEFVVFVELGLRFTRRGGYSSLVVPNKLLGAEYCADIQRLLRGSRIQAIRDYTEAKPFEANVYPIVYVTSNDSVDPEHTVVLETMSDAGMNEPIVARRTEIAIKLLDRLPAGYWWPIFSENGQVLGVCLSISKELADLADILGAATVSEAYEIADLILDEDPTLHEQAESLFLVNTGTIDRYTSLWGKQKTQYIGASYEHPIIPQDSLAHEFPKRFEQAKSPKLILAGMVTRLEAHYDQAGEIVAGKSTVIVLDFEWNPFFLLSILNSKLCSFLFRELFGALALQGGYLRVGPPQVQKIPIRSIRFTTSDNERDGLVTKLVEDSDNGEYEAVLSKVEALLPKSNEGRLHAIQPGAKSAEEYSDVVHDLLAHLAKQMIEMNQQKQAFVEAFWDGLEAATDAGTFDSLRNKGKWEQTLASDPACQPYVEQESRSTSHLDDSLGWDEECFAAFVGMLAGRTSVTPSLIGVYRHHHPPYRALVERIAATDDLIDQIVYRLYGLTDEEIAVVEGEAE